MRVGSNTFDDAEKWTFRNPIFCGVWWGIVLTEVFDGTIPSKIIFPFPWNPYLKTGGTSLLILFLVKNFEEKEIEFLKEQFCLKLLSNNYNNWANGSPKVSLPTPKTLIMSRCSARTYIELTYFKVCIVPELNGFRKLNFLCESRCVGAYSTTYQLSARPSLLGRGSSKIA